MQNRLAVVKDIRNRLVGATFCGAKETDEVVRQRGRQVWKVRWVGLLPGTKFGTVPMT